MTNTHMWPENEKDGGNPELVTSNMRRCKAVWNILDDPTRTTATVGWLNTWPAEEVNGYMVTSYVAIGSAKQVTIKGAIHKDVPKQTYPESLYDGISSLIIDIDDVTAEDIKDILAVPAEDDPIWDVHRTSKKDMDKFPGFRIVQDYYKGLRWSYANNLSYTNITKYLLDNYHTNFTAVYLEGVDTIGHRFWVFMKDEDYIRQRLEYCGFDPDLAPVLKEAFGKVLENFYIFTDKLVGELVAAAPEDTITIIVSDHGFEDYPEITSAPEMPFSGQHAIDGVILMSGPAVQPGAVIEDAHVADITPTILYLLGKPVGEDMTGKVLAGPLVNTFTTNNLVKKIKTYETITAGKDEKPIAAPGIDKALQDKLESLGYTGETDLFSPETEDKGN
jgi:predicted AlkP superfamily phosphohydrolase/phosphomutase